MAPPIPDDPSSPSRLVDADTDSALRLAPDSQRREALGWPLEELARTAGLDGEPAVRDDIAALRAGRLLGGEAERAVYDVRDQMSAAADGVWATAGGAGTTEQRDARVVREQAGWAFTGLLSPPGRTLVRCPTSVSPCCIPRPRTPALRSWKCWPRLPGMSMSSQKAGRPCGPRYTPVASTTRILTAVGADPWLSMMAGWSPGRLSLAGPEPDLFPNRPDGVALTPAETEAIAEPARRSRSVTSAASRTRVSSAGTRACRLCAEPIRLTSWV